MYFADGRACADIIGPEKDREALLLLVASMADAYKALLMQAWTRKDGSRCFCDSRADNHEARCVEANRVLREAGLL